MQEAVDEILHYTQGLTQEQFQADGRIVDAVVWNVTVLGEAAKQIPREVALAFPEVPWRRIRGIRDRTVHAYDEIDFDIIWRVITVELPAWYPCSNAFKGRPRSNAQQRARRSSESVHPRYPVALPPTGSPKRFPSAADLAMTLRVKRPESACA
jgi:uncharacterized protein with HEPN domain